MVSIRQFRNLQPTWAAHDPSSNVQQFSFVTVLNPDELKHKTHKRQIRKHAKRDVDRVKAKRHRAGIEDLNTKTGLVPASGPETPTTRTISSPLSDGAFSFDSKLQAADSDEVNFEDLEYLRPIGAGRGFEPFLSYPFKPTARMVMLLDHMLEAQSLHKRSIRMLWITIGMLDRDAFNITMANAANFLASSQGLGYVETTESTHFYTITVQAVSKRLATPSESTTDGLIGAILGLACLDVGIRF